MMAHADKNSQAFNKKVFEQIQAGKIPESDMWKYSSFWYKDFDGMAIKTMLRQIISKWGVMSIDLQKASLSDGAVIREDGSADFVETAEAEEEKVVAVQEAVEAPKVETPAPVKVADQQPQAPAQTQDEQLPGQMSFGDEDDLNKAFL